MYNNWCLLFFIHSARCFVQRTIFSICGLLTFSPTINFFIQLNNKIMSTCGAERIHSIDNCYFNHKLN